MNTLTRGRGNLISQANRFVELGVRVKKELPKAVTEQAEVDPEIDSDLDSDFDSGPALGPNKSVADTPRNTEPDAGESIEENSYGSNTV